MKIKSFLMFGYMIFALSGCSINETKKAENSPPLEFPIDLSKGEQQINFKVNILEDSTWGIGMDFYATKPIKSSIFYHPEETLENNQKISKILQVDNRAESGVPARFKIKIINTATKEVLLEDITNRPNTNARYRGRSCFMFIQKFPKGDYDINLQYMPRSSDLSQLYANIIVGSPSNGK